MSSLILKVKQTHPQGLKQSLLTIQKVDSLSSTSDSVAEEQKYHTNEKTQSKSYQFDTPSSSSYQTIFSKKKMKSIKFKTQPEFPELSTQNQVIFNGIKTEIQEVFFKYGYTPIETRLVESQDLIIERGIEKKEIYNLGRVNSEERNQKKQKKAIRYDLTLPFVRYINENSRYIQYPFKRSQIQQVYRGVAAKKNQGRYQEFYQSDIDVIGKNELDFRYDAQFPCIIYEIFKNVIKIDNFTMRISNRKILQGLFALYGIEQKNLKKAISLIDNMENVSKQETMIKLEELGLQYQQWYKLQKFLNIARTHDPIATLKALENQISQNRGKLVKQNSFLKKGISELLLVFEHIKSNSPEAYLKTTFDPSIARGLDYYTGTVYETTLHDYPELGSVCSGGRYDHLSQSISKNQNENYPGVGLSIGLTRLMNGLIEKNHFSFQCKSVAQVIVLVKDWKLENECSKLANLIRKQGVNCDIYMNSNASFSKQLKYAGDNKFLYAVYLVPDQQVIISTISKDDDNNNHGKKEENIHLSDLGNRMEQLINSDKQSLVNYHFNNTNNTNNNIDNKTNNNSDQIQQFLNQIFLCNEKPKISLKKMDSKLCLRGMREYIEDNKQDIFVFWYHGSHGSSKEGKKFYQPFLEILEQKNFFLLDLQAWAAFAYPNAKLSSKLIDNGEYSSNYIHCSDFFEFAVHELKEKKRLNTEQWNKILNEKKLFDISREYAQKRNSKSVIYMRSVIDLEDFEEEKEACEYYSTFQFIEMMYIIDQIVLKKQGQKYVIHFLLPNDELKYYDLDLLQQSLGEFLLLKGIQVQVFYQSFSYGNSDNDRPYNKKTH